MLPGTLSNPCGSNNWFVRNREEETFPTLTPAESVLDCRGDGPVDSTHLSVTEESPPLPTRKFSGRDPFKPPVNPGQRVVDVARTLEGRTTRGLVGQLKGLRGTRDGNLMCADFVTSMLGKGGLMKGHYTNVDDMKEALKSQGWKRIPAQQARPGDVAITFNGEHTELVAANGGTSLIGSNNWGRTAQSIREHPQDPSQAIYWGRR